METKLIVRVPRHLLENAKRYASAHNTTLTKLILAYLDRIPDERELLNSTVVRKLTGLLSSDVSVEDYKTHLEEKYIGR